MIDKSVNPGRQNINITHERVQNEAYQAQPNLGVNHNSQPMQNQKINRLNYFKVNLKNLLVNNSIPLEANKYWLEIPQFQDCHPPKIWSAVYQAQKRKQNALKYAKCLKQANDKPISSAISGSYKEVLNYDQQLKMNINRVGVNGLQKPLERNDNSYYENSKQKISTQLSTETANIDAGGGSDDPNGSDDSNSPEDIDDLGDHSLSNSKPPNANHQNQNNTIQKQSDASEQDPIENEKYSDKTKIIVGTTLINIVTKIQKLREQNKRVGRKITCMDYIKVTGKQLGKGTVVFGSKYLEKIIGIGWLLQAGTIFVKKAIDNNRLSLKDIKETVIDALKLEIQKLCLNTIVCQNVLKFFSKVTTNFASNSRVNQSKITANMNNFTRIASNLAKENIATFIISFTVGSIFDIVKGKDVKESLKQNAKTSVGSTVGGFLGGLIGSIIPVVGTTVGGAVGSVIGSYFASWF